MSASLELEAMVRRALEAGRPITLIALGNSMFPTIVAGSQLSLEPDAGRRPRRGDVVAVPRPDGGIAIHRVVVVHPDERVTTWGDALPKPDGWGPSPVLAWARLLAVPWQPGALRRWWGAARARSHVLFGGVVKPDEAP